MITLEEMAEVHIQNMGTNLSELEAQHVELTERINQLRYHLQDCKNTIEGKKEG